MNNCTISRRKFVTTGTLALSGLMTMGLPLVGKSASANDVIQVGLIGAGSRGAGLATVMKGIPGLKLIACCDVIPEHLEKGMALAEKGAKAYTDYRKLLADKDIDAVIIATPLYLHQPMAIAALDAGKHVYSEKAMAYDIPQTLALLQKIRTSKLIFQLGFQYRYYPLYHKVKEVISQNWLGKVTHFECQYNMNGDWRRPVDDPKLERAINWRMYREYCGGPLSELCAHQIDAVNFILDSHPLKVTGIGGIDYWKDGRETYDNVRTIYEYPNGVKSSVTSVLSNAYDGYNIKILGDRATIEIQRNKAFIYAESLKNKRGVVDGVTGATIAVTTQGEGQELVFGEPGKKTPEPTITALQGFYESIHSGKTPLSNAENGKDTTIAIHMGNEAADTEAFQSWKPEYSA